MGNRPYTWVEEEYDHSYDDIIHLHRPKSKNHPPMPMAARAAQFSAFDALSGYSDVIKETARITDGRMDLSVEEWEMLDQKIRILMDAITAAGKYGEKPTVTILYFVPDARKDGGSFKEITGTVKRIDTANREIILARKEKMPGGDTIRLDDVVDMQGDIFSGMIQEIS